MPKARSLAQLRNEVGTAAQLHAALREVTQEGWDGPVGSAVLDYARQALVLPAVRRAGFTGADAEFAEATGWAAAWESLNSRSIRSAASPWGVVNSAVRTAVVNERMAEMYGTDPWSAWRVHRFKQARRDRARQVGSEWKTVADPAAMNRPLSLSALLDAGYEPAAASQSSESTAGWRLNVLTELLVRHGWRRDAAEGALQHVADCARANPAGTPKAHGWREMALELAIPPWQARRVTVLLLGTREWPGLVHRLAVGGEAALEGPAVAAAFRATVDASMRPPARAALAVDARCSRQPALAS